ncbi:unnamed protein product [Aureobasidium mustum]|uniref:Uncharacterized protein n=1 Tax=Aureobasidium mustum TaxID=2773714 RepID=A0A9N8JYJ3_9PEZI|nr:unnamed protein product [Aureobasidium mustum]
MDSQGNSQDSGCDEPSSPSCSEDSSTLEPQTKIHDPFAELSPSEQSSIMSAHLQRYEERMTDSNKRTLHRVLDIISATEGDDAIHLDILATHMGRESRTICDQKTWPGYIQLEQEIVRPSDLKTSEDWVSSGVLCLYEEEFVASFLRDLKIVVRNKADKDLLGTATETFDLPAEYCEFARQCGGIFYENYDRTRFTCPFGSQFYHPEDMAVPLERMTRIFNDDGYFEVAAGWRVGDNELTTSLYYMLCRVTADMDEPWQWRIGYFDYDTPDMRLWENLPDFLEWYSEGYDRVIWENVEGTIERIHETCLEELEGGQTR